MTDPLLNSAISYKRSACSTAASANANGRQFVVLSLDGGGMRGIVSLMVLKALEERLGRPISTAVNLMAGTSAGGLTALSLGWRGLTVDATMALFSSLGASVFSEKQFLSKGLNQLLYPRWQVPLYSHERLESSLQEQFGSGQLYATQPQQTPCPVFVTTQVRYGQRTRELRLLRSYAKPLYRGGRLVVDGIESLLGDGADGCTAWQAGRATSAGQTFFAPMKIGVREFEDGGFGCNNPSMEAWWEAQAVNDHSPNVTYVVISVGTGDSPDTSHDLVHETLTHQLTSCDIVHRQMERVARHAANRTVYFRFSPMMSRTISLDDTSPSVVTELRDTTVQYLQTNDCKLKLDTLVNVLAL